MKILPILNKMNVFQKAITDIFSDKNFLETCLIEDQIYDVICSPMEQGLVYSDVGLIDDVNFVLNIKLPVPKIPKKGDNVKFRNVNYNV